MCFVEAGLACKDKTFHPLVVIETSAGDITVELYPDKAPRTTSAFLTYIDSGYYTESSFYRILSEDNQPTGVPKSELIQGGLWKSKNSNLNVEGIVHESTKQSGLSHINGTLSLARLAPGTGSTEFFICIGNQAGFDFGGENNPDGQGYAAFGRVIQGMDVVMKIYRRPETNQYFIPPIRINNIVKK